METIILNIEDGYIKFYLSEVIGFPNQTSHFGGYDISGQVEIKSKNYFVKGALFFTTGEIYDLYTQVKKIFDSLSGSAEYDSYEAQLSFSVKIDNVGHIMIIGEYQENLAFENKLFFEIKGDQSYLKDWLIELKKIVVKYGDNYGKK